ncbi:hypothetical protein P3X46_003505 [Hevea brasiliensis]|uniref:SMP domain-containing protein n=1 Tax=Hevea brasiliensis TaxID=3981 RepID=A0ABQ9N8P9_HEVBR|nr:hypothetical protein P3X46_003505 [Hevea brasiliensis]
MQSAESQVLGRPQRGGPAAVMQSAANVNVRAGLVDPDGASEVVREECVTVTETNIGGTRGVSESVGGQVVGQCVDPSIPAAYPRSAYDITIGEALEATAYTAAGEKPIDQSEAAAIKAAELRALRSNETPSSGIGAQDSTAKLPRDKPVTHNDAERVTAAEMRNKPDLRTTPGGFASSMAAAARLNQNP